MKVTFLGTGTSQGVPVIACACRVCKSSDKRDKRLRTSVMIEDKGKVIVIDSGNLKFQGEKKDLLPLKNSFIAKICGKMEKINPIFVLDLKFKGGDTIIEVPEKYLQQFLKEVLESGKTILSINRKNSSMEDVIFGVN